MRGVGCEVRGVRCVRAEWNFSSLLNAQRQSDKVNNKVNNWER